MSLRALAFDWNIDASTAALLAQLTALAGWMERRAAGT
jgi:hypothetical protein